MFTWNGGESSADVRRGIVVVTSILRSGEFRSDVVEYKEVGTMENKLVIVKILIMTELMVNCDGPCIFSFYFTSNGKENKKEARTKTPFWSISTGTSVARIS